MISPADSGRSNPPAPKTARIDRYDTSPTSRPSATTGTWRKCRRLMSEATVVTESSGATVKTTRVMSSATDPACAAT
jgi:hypothetical protein